MKLSYIHETFCPKCKEKIYYNGLLTSKQTDALFKMLTLVCFLCITKFNALKEYEFYLVYKSKCDKENTSLQSSPATSPKSNSISDVFKINKDNIPQELEEAALHIITLKIKKSGENVAEFKSGGPRPIIFTQTPKAYVKSDQASISTIRLCNNNITNHLEIVTGNLGDSVVKQTNKLIKSFTRQSETRQSILKSAKINHTDINASVMVAMKTDMGLSLEKLKIMSM
ncbi:uncharacterized protein LOC101237694 [Hydra vulgaris]|uniref:uncharacterized protein LOC101237694 n=1 Tax=Hydra vulgaris TaxID=6087 RepID=UPI0032EA3613